MGRCIKVRDLLQALRALGCRVDRTTGSHQIWRTPAGAQLVVVINHANAEVSRQVLASIRHTLRGEGISLGRVDRGACRVGRLR